MGTHPIFESDFDCLTDCNEKMVQDNCRICGRRMSHHIGSDWDLAGQGFCTGAKGLVKGATVGTAIFPGVGTFIGSLVGIVVEAIKEDPSVCDDCKRDRGYK